MNACVEYARVRFAESIDSVFIENSDDFVQSDLCRRPCQGVAAIRSQAAEDTELKRALITVFLTPASIAILEQRLRKRGTDPEEDVQKRLSVAREEIAKWKQCDYLIISTTIAEDLRRMQAILEAEKMRQGRAQPPEI